MQEIILHDFDEDLGDGTLNPDFCTLKSFAVFNFAVNTYNFLPKMTIFGSVS
jgi:hypothetical protein